MNEEARLRRWRLVLGGQGEPPVPTTGLDGRSQLSETDQHMDKVLEALYDSDRKAGLGSSSPHVNRWLGDIRRFFPASVVRIMQKDALQRLNLQQMLFEKETLETVIPDVHLVSTLLTLKNVIPNKTKATARLVVKQVVDDLLRRLKQPMRQADRGALSRATRTSKPRVSEIDWHRTIRKNLKNYQPDARQLIADQLVGMGRRQSSLRDVVLCVDQSGSMASSVVYSSVFAAVLASLPAVRMQLVVFDTAVVDLTDLLADPVDVLFGTQLGGGTDIAKALTYCQQQITRPTSSILVLVSDLVEGGHRPTLLRQTTELMQRGVMVISLLALSDDGSPAYDESLASQLSQLGIPCFACTPDHFPSLMAAALQRLDVRHWAGRQGLVLRG